MAPQSSPLRNQTKLTRQDRSDRTRAAILESATGLFLQRGYAGVSINRVINSAGGSKETIYRYFKNKDGLCLAIIKNELLKSTQSLDDLVVEHEDLREGLEYIGCRVMNVIMTERFLSFHRLVVNESIKRPALGHEFYENISSRSYRILADYFKQHISKGHLIDMDPARLAEYYWAMMLHKVMLKFDFQRLKTMHRRQITGHVKQVVGDFLLGFGT